MDYGMPTFIEFDSLENNCQLCKNIGFDFVEINMNFPEYQIKNLDADRILKLKEKYGIYFTIHLPENLDIADVNPEIRNVWLNTVSDAIELAKKIGAPIINMHLNHGIYITLPEKKVYIYEKNIQDYKNSFLYFRKMCEEKIGSDGIKIAIENTDGFMGFEKDALDSLFESPVFCLTWDVGHSISSDEVDMEFLLSHVNRLGHFHIHDGTRCSHGGKCHQELGKGEVNIESRLCLARECKARCVIETKTSQAIKKSVEWLRCKGKLR